MQECTSTKLYENSGRLSWVQRERFWMLYLNCGVITLEDNRVAKPWEKQKEAHSSQT